MTSLAAPNAASSSVARYSLAARLTEHRIELFAAPLRSRDRTLLVGVRRNQARIDRKPFAANQTGPDARADDTLEHTAKNIAVAEAVIAGTRERRVVGDLVLDAELAEPAVCEVHLHLTAKRPLRADGEHVTDDEHPDHEHRIDRGAADRGIVGRQLGVHPRQIENGVDLAHQMISRNGIVEVELVEQLALIALQPPHHGKPPAPYGAGTESLFAANIN